ncbi:MAG: prenyltransferase/squalene oxidase repeat-containing protein [Planctomycetota bacterium]
MTRPLIPSARTRSAWLPSSALAAALAIGVLAMPSTTRMAQPQEPKAPDAQPADNQPPAEPAIEPVKVRGAENNAAKSEFTATMDRSVNRGLAWLARKQNPDGSFGGMQTGPSVAISALGGLAFMSDGNLPDRGPYGDSVTKALEFVLKNCSDNGLIAADAGAAPMYGHGFATLFLGEIYGMTSGGGDTTQAQRIHEALVRAVRLIESSQNEEGGWRYNPVPLEADTSVTICQIMGLRSARNAGIEVSKGVIDRAVDYVRRAQNADGGFKYQLTGGPSAFPRSAASVASLQYAGIYDDPAIVRGLQYLLRRNLPGNGQSLSMQHYFYGQYYAVQAAYLAGGETWATWWPAVREELIEAQRPDASWADQQVGEHYGTAMALIVLQMPKRYLPIFQR